MKHRWSEKMIVEPPDKIAGYNINTRCIAAGT
jgi:hypothetical protein